ncbi:PTS transporter subunit EIIB [Mycoplasmopsis columbina]|uniref:PTS transporter subunit EIIB n=1 Tax=Mycoplasmopsis columbina TaxID=114881 RepID=UPI0004A73FD8|nr:PTS transporter subunit EIIB [Mycoplasmopsis columbina]VEU76905.1 putative PTS system glucose-specific enzyme II [Mycoplasmopsis columbina]
MKAKDKLLIGFYTVITLGLCWVYWKKQAKKKSIEEVKNQELPKYINLDELILLLGGKENIKSINSSLSNLKLEINNRSLVETKKLSELKYVSGIMVGDKKISLVVGDDATAISKELSKKII